MSASLLTPPRSKKFALALVLVAVFIVIASLAANFFLQPQNLAKSELAKLATDYYENYYYDRLAAKKNPQKLTEVLSHYSEVGLPSVRLRQLLLFDNQRHAKSIQYFTAYQCDTNQTAVKYFPLQPYGKKDYRVEYTYACEDS